MSKFDAYAALYDRGLAIGHSSVANDTMVFRFRNETFEFPSAQVHPFAAWNGYFYEISIDALRQLETEVAKGK